MPLKIVPDVVSEEPPLICNPATTVIEAAIIMRAAGKAAVIVSDQGELAGIFTEQDVSLRVVAAGLAPDRTPLGEVMTANPVTIEASNTTLQALAKMHAGKFRHLPVMAHGRLINMVSLRDIYASANDQLELELGHLKAEVDLRQTVVSYMAGGERLISFASDDSVLEAAKAMAERIIGSVLVTENNKLIGIFTERDVSFRVVAKGLDPKTTTLAQVMTENPETIGPNQLCGDILDKMRQGGFRHLPVIDRDKLIGVISIRDIYAAVIHDLEINFGNAMRGRAQSMMSQ